MRHGRAKFANLPKSVIGFAVGRNRGHVSINGGTLFQQQPDHSKNSHSKLDIAAALKRDAQRLSDDAEALRQAEIDRIHDLLIAEPERWDGLS